MPQLRQAWALTRQVPQLASGGQEIHRYRFGRGRGGGGGGPGQGNGGQAGKGGRGGQGGPEVAAMTAERYDVL